MPVAKWTAGGIAAFALCVLLAGPAEALDVSDSVAFNAVNLSPWDSGPAIDLNNDQTLSKSFNVDIPDISASPVKALADFLGVPLPVDADVSIGAHTDGNVALDLGYAVTGGRLNVSYPAVGKITIPTDAGTNTLASSSFTLNTSFLPGLKQTFVPSGAAIISLGGGGYALQPSNLGFNITQFKNPVFTTTFPSFAAWADAAYDINAGASINADLKVFGACIVCASKTFTLGDSESFPIVELNSGSVKVLGQTVAALSGTTIPIVPGEVSATINFPNLKVGGALQPDNSLAGSGAQSVIQLNLSLEKLVPVIGAFLSNSIGPFGYNLLSADGGPNLGVYQDFRFTPQPKVKLDFSQALLVQGADGIYRPTNEVEFNLGDDLNIKVPVGTHGDLTVRPTYILDNQFSNETGITLGASIDVSGLALTSSFGDLGPAFEDTLTANALVKIPLYDNSFEEPFGTILANPFTIDTNNGILQQYVFLGAQALAGGDFDLSFEDSATGQVLHLQASGQVVNFPILCPPELGLQCDTLDVHQSILETAEDLFLNNFDLGDAFCLVCGDFTSEVTHDPSSPIVTDETTGDPLYITDLSRFPSGDCESNIGLCDGTFALSNRAIVPSDPTTTQIVEVGATVVVSEVPEPGSLPLLAGGVLSWFALRRLCGRRRANILAV